MQAAEIRDLVEGQRGVLDSQTAVAFGINGARMMIPDWAGTTARHPIDIIGRAADESGKHRAEKEDG